MGPTAQIQIKFTPRIRGPGAEEKEGSREVAGEEGDGYGCGIGGGADRPRLTRRPDMTQGRNSTVELLLWRRWERIIPQDSSVVSIRRASGSADGSIGGSAEGVAAGVRLWGSGEIPA